MGVGCSRGDRRHAWVSEARCLSLNPGGDVLPAMLILLRKRQKMTVSRKLKTWYVSQLTPHYRGLAESLAERPPGGKGTEGKSSSAPQA